MTAKSKMKTALFLFAVATVVYSVRSKRSHGRFLGVPFDWRKPTVRGVKERLWNRADRRLFTPTVFGIGWVPNAYQLVRRLRGPKADLEADPDASTPNDEGEGEEADRPS